MRILETTSNCDQRKTHTMRCVINVFYDYLDFINVFYFQSISATRSQYFLAL